MKIKVRENIFKVGRHDHIIKEVYLGNKLIQTIKQWEYSNFEQLDEIINSIKQQYEH